MPRQIDETKRDLARELIEERGYSQKRTAEAVGVSVNTIRNWIKKGEWVKGVEPVAETIIESFADEQTKDAPEMPELAVEQRIAELEREVEEAQQRAEAAEEAASDFKTVAIYGNPDEVLEWFGEELINDVVTLHFGKLNKDRVSKGLMPIDPEKVAPEEFAKVKAELLEDILSRRTKWVDPMAIVRVVKMWNPAGFMAQIPIEEHFNNEKGVRGSALLHYKNKGFKLIRPYLCQMNNCWAEALVEDGKIALDGYCSHKHYQMADPHLYARRFGTAPGTAVGPLATSETVGY